MKTALLLVTFISVMIVNGQKPRFVVEESNNNPVQFATVKVLNKPKGTLTSETGEYFLSIAFDDSIEITAMNYDKLIVKGSAIPDTIFLQHKYSELPAIRVFGKKIKSRMILGRKYKKSKTDVAWGAVNLKEEFAQEFTTPHAILQLTKIFIPIDNAGNCRSPMIIRVYKGDPIVGKPGEQIMLKYIRLTHDLIKKNVLTVDVEADSLYLVGNEKFYVSVAWPERSNECKARIVVSRKSSEKSVERHLLSSSYNWQVFGNMLDLQGKLYHLSTVFYVEVAKLE